MTLEQHPIAALRRIQGRQGGSLRQLVGQLQRIIELHSLALQVLEIHPRLGHHLGRRLVDEVR